MFFFFTFFERAMMRTRLAHLAVTFVSLCYCSRLHHCVVFAVFDIFWCFFTILLSSGKIFVAFRHFLWLL